MKGRATFVKKMYGGLPGMWLGEKFSNDALLLQIHVETLDLV